MTVSRNKTVSQSREPSGNFFGGYSVWSSEKSFSSNFLNTNPPDSEKLRASLPRERTLLISFLFLSASKSRRNTRGNVDERKEKIKDEKKERRRGEEKSGKEEFLNFCEENTAGLFIIYLVASSTAAKTEPVAPLVLRQLDAVFLHVSPSSSRGRKKKKPSSDQCNTVLLHVSPVGQKKKNIFNSSLNLILSREIWFSRWEIFPFFTPRR